MPQFVHAFHCCTLALPVAVAGCAATATDFARAQQLAQEFNTDTRFGRTDRLTDHISPNERDDYARHHRQWGGEIRLADLEIAGMTPRNESDLDVLVRVAWYRMSDQELHSTTLTQTWRTENLRWQLVKEQRFDGDVGLL